jgi:hypothetical protein
MALGSPYPKFRSSGVSGPSNGRAEGQDVTQSSPSPEAARLACVHLRFRQDDGLQVGPSSTPELDGISR